MLAGFVGVALVVPGAPRVTNNTSPTVLYVSCDSGNDAWEHGNETHPFRTPHRARDQARALRANAPSHIIIRVAGVCYLGQHPLTLDSVTGDSNTTWTNWHTGLTTSTAKVVLSGGIAVADWSALQLKLKQNRTVALWRATLPAGHYPRQMWVGEHRRVRARHPNVRPKLGGKFHPLVPSNMSSFSLWLSLLQPTTPTAEVNRHGFVYDSTTVIVPSMATGGNTTTSDSALTLTPTSRKPVEVVVYHAWDASHHKVAQWDSQNRWVRTIV